jgi:filamentous hemagglutinin family protein
MARAANGHKHRIRVLSAAVATCFAASSWSATEADLARIANGTATFDQVGRILNITNSNGAILDWARFGIAAGDTVKFIQASASSSVLNRVLAGGGLSAIYGTLSSNGRVWLVNPAGILVGPGGTIDTAGFVASTLAVRNEDFLAGRLTFSGPGGEVINQGTITTPAGGSVYLIGGGVSNEGIINSPQGEVILAAGQTVNLVDTATPGVKVEISGAAGNTTNLGSVMAEAGRIGMAGVIVRNSGTLNASSAVEQGGKVFLRASQDAYVDGNGRIVATGTKGGRVEVLGNRVAVMDSASIDASGVNGGGTVLVGGDYQGKNPDVRNARITYFGPNASIRANAGNVGDGGTVIVWADDTTRAYGTIEARGGASGGNGGFVETSGHRYLDFHASVDTSAPFGLAGTLLLDPTDITIEAGSYSATGGGFSGGYFIPGAATSTVYAGSISTLLNTTDVTISTSSGYAGTGDITFAAGATVTNSSGYARNFSLQADRDIVMSAGSTIQGASDSPLGVYMTAGRHINTSPGTIITWSGDVEMRAATGAISAGIINTSAEGVADYANGGHVVMEAGLGVSTGNIDTRGNSDCGSECSPGSSAGGSVKITAHGGSILTGSITTRGGSEGYSGMAGGSVELQADAGGVTTGNIDTRGGDSGYTGSAGYIGGAGNFVKIMASGNITTGTIHSDGGGGTTGGDAGWIWLDADGHVTTGSIVSASGGSYSAFTASDADFGGAGNTIYVRASGSVYGGATDFVADGGYGNYAGGNAGAVVISLGSGATITSMGTVSVAGGGVGSGYAGSSGSVAIQADAAFNTSAASPVLASISGTPSVVTILSYDTLTVDGAGINVPYDLGLGGSTVNIGSPVTALGLGVMGGTINVTANVTTTNDLGMVTLGPMTVTGATLQAGGHVGLWANDGITLSSATVRSTGASAWIGSGGVMTFDPVTGVSGIGKGDITAYGSTVEALAGDVYAFTGGDISLENGSHLKAGYEVHVDLIGADSTLSLSGPPPSTIEASPTTIYLTFLGRSGGGVLIDGVETTTTLAGGSGFYVGGSPATAGNGLFIAYPNGALDPAVANILTNTTTDSTSLNDDLNADLAGSGAGGPVTSLDDQTAGGGEGEFGDDGKGKPGRRRVGQCRS